MGYLLKTNWWKWICVLLLFYTMIGGLLFPVPRLPILNETIRVLHFHVPMWFGMIFLFMGSMIYAIRYLKTEDKLFEIYSYRLASTGIAMGVLGVISGMIWAHFTWGQPWVNDPKLNGSAISLLIYLAYFVLRNSLNDEEQQTRIAAVYNVFAFFLMVPLVFIIPRLSDSLHPGNGGNPGFNSYDLDSNLRKVFYFAVMGWALLGYWIATISTRLSLVKKRWEDA
ncbi:MAG: cytochrome c biogenesis protein CcsA [Ekhidna sp.]|nr:cytochrome c biogenesis protein CcsA [Ekhidna sp.]MBC6410889.1 cytochrome c biogenesis protein CcsA [Ekhidna sp.]MBC6427459.1 cytochrome c biogenesis protein CcsA [Ekhidna sp.]